jgi:uncharacterized C2H2 Zn-finger protein
MYIMGAPPVDDANYCLRWNDYEKKYAETFRTLREDIHFADVTLAVDGHSMKAHRIILCACSSYFQNILRSINPLQHPVLLLSDVQINDLTALMDFIYFGQVNITQDSLNSFLKVAEKLKIKGLCERGTLIPEGPPFHNTITIPLQKEKKADLNSPNSILPHGANFETLLPRSPYMTSEHNTANVAVQGGQVLPSIRHNNNMNNSGGAPPAHQSPKNSHNGLNIGGPRGTTRPAPPPSEPQYMLISSPKKTRYSTTSMGLTPTTSNPSILRNQLISKDLNGSNGVEVKSEPLLMSTSHNQEDVPSSVASVSVTEFITTPEGDLLPPLHQGLPAGFISTFDPSGGDPGAIAPAPATHVTIQPEKDTITSVSGSGFSTTRVVSLSVANNAGNQIYATQTQGQLDDHEPKDLTPMHDVEDHVGTPGMSAMNTSTSSSGKKDRNARKNCPHCNKDFHEMSLKRHINDIHLRNQDTYVICPQCCKQYSSQNSLYSHLNRVHGVKKDELQLLANSVNTDGGLLVRQGPSHNDSNHVMDLAQHSDQSN